MNLQYLKILEEVKQAGSCNLILEQCVEKYSKNSNVIIVNLISLKEEVKSVQDKNAEEINRNIKEGIKLTANHSNIILRQIKVFKDEVLSLEEDNGKNTQDILQLLGTQVRINSLIHIIKFDFLFVHDQTDHPIIPISI